MSDKLQKAVFPGSVFTPGPRNKITDVSGIRVGHTTVSRGAVQTGVTAVLPSADNIYLSKLPAAAHVINGYGKTCGLLQIRELGCIETPIVLTNTLSTGTAFTALCRYMLERNPMIGVEECSVNPVVCECNDGYLNDIRGLHITEADVLSALENAAEDFDEGAVGAGRGMSCHGLKGGIGSSSRILKSCGRTFTLGVLVLTNHARIEQLRIGCCNAGPLLAPSAGSESPFKGSVITLLATDAPLSDRQLGRLSRRVQNGLARTGSTVDSGSGEIAIAFSTAGRIPHYPSGTVSNIETLHDSCLDQFFAAASEAVEEAVISSLLEAETVHGRDGHTRRSLVEVAEEAGVSLW